MNQPLVSILMPCYNVEKYVEESLYSILDQTYKNIEIIAIDDCSEDNTSKILHQLATKDNRIRVINNEENLRLIATLNKGILLCDGEYIARMDADDISLPTRIEREVEFLEKHKDHDIVSCQFYAFKSDTPNKKSRHYSPLHHDELQAYMLFKSGICHPAVMMRKRVFTELGLRFEKEYLHVEDYALWSEAIYKTKLANMEEALLLYRVHESQVSLLNEDLQTENKKKVFEIHSRHLGLPISEYDIDIYASVAEAIPSESSLEYIKKCEKFMLSLLQMNSAKPFCNDKYLQWMLSMHWIRLCANSRLGFKVMHLLKSSPLFIKDNYSCRDLVILNIKCMFKLRYKKAMIYKLIFR